MTPRTGWTRFIVSATVLCLLSGCEAASPSKDTRTTTADATARADAMLKDYTPNRPGLAVLVGRGNDILYERNLGGADLEHGAPVTADTRFHVASVSKQFTAFAILLLAREGKLDLDADIHQYLPELADYGSKVTVSELAHHTSGIRDQWELLLLSGMHIEDLITQKQIMAMGVAQKGLNFEPGTDFAYSNMGYSLLAEIVARVSGVPFRRYLHDHIFAPLDMNNTLVYDDATEMMVNRAMSYSIDAKGVVHLDRLNYSNYGATSLHTTTHDLLKWSRELLHPKVFPPDLIRTAMSPGQLKDGRPITYGFGMATTEFAGHRAISHGGSDAGYRSMIASFPDDDLSIVVFSNGAADVGAITNGLAEAFLGKRDDLPPVVVADSARAAKLAGLYIDGWGPGRKMVARNGKLYAKNGATDIEATFLADGSFYVGSPSNRFQSTANGDLVPVKPFGGVVTTLRRVVRATPSAAELQQIAGVYHSDELDVTYRLAVSGDKLVLSTLRSDPQTLVPAEKDQFDSDDIRVSVVRNSAGRVSGIAVASGRVRNLFFARRDVGF